MPRWTLLFVLCAAAAAVLPWAPGGVVPAGPAGTVGGAGEPLRADRDEEPGVHWLEREAYLMGTRLRVRIGADGREDALSASEAAIRAVERLEARLSTWRPDTELARANRAPVSEAVALSPELGGLLADAFRWSSRTGGAFEPAVGALVDAWDLRGDGRRPAPAELDRALEAVGSRGIRLGDDGATLTRLDSAAWIDAGGFGKGAALRRAGAALREAGVRGALLDFGGQLLALGSGPGEARGWPASVAHPSDRSRPLVELELRNASVATTGASERAVEIDGERMGHVLDPRTGRPVASWGSVSVVADDPAMADALSTALFVMGPDEALAWARGRSEVGVLAVETRPDGPAVRWNHAMEAWLIRDQ